MALKGPLPGSKGNATLSPDISDTVATSWTVYLSKVTTLTRFLQTQFCPWMYEVCCA